MNNQHDDHPIWYVLAFVVLCLFVYIMSEHAQWRDANTQDPQCETLIDGTRICGVPDYKREVYK